MDAARCPKCGTPRPPEGPACARCGLRLDRWAGFATEEPRPHPILDGAWHKLEAAWDDPAEHERLLTIAGTVAALDGAAARYRRRLREHPGDGPATRALEQLSALALRQADEARPEPLPGLRALYVALVAVGLVMLAGAIVFLWKVAVLRQD